MDIAAKARDIGMDGDIRKGRVWERMRFFVVYKSIIEINIATYLGIYIYTNFLGEKNWNKKMIFNSACINRKWHFSLNREMCDLVSTAAAEAATATTLNKQINLHPFISQLWQFYLRNHKKMHKNTYTYMHENNRVNTNEKLLELVVKLTMIRKYTLTLTYTHTR